MIDDWKNADANGIYWWRYDAAATPEPVEVRDGMFYSIADPDPTSTTLGEFLGPITPEQFLSMAQAFATFEQYQGTALGICADSESRHVFCDKCGAAGCYPR